MRAIGLGDARLGRQHHDVEQLGEAEPGEDPRQPTVEVRDDAGGEPSARRRSSASRAPGRARQAAGAA